MNTDIWKVGLSAKLGEWIVSRRGGQMLKKAFNNNIIPKDQDNRTVSGLPNENVIGVIVRGGGSCHG